VGLNDIFSDCLFPIIIFFSIFTKVLLLVWSDQLSLLPSAGQEMTGSYKVKGYCGWLEQCYVCWLQTMDPVVLLARATDGCIGLVRCGIISSCQSAATSETLKRLLFLLDPVSLAKYVEYYFDDVWLKRECCEYSSCCTKPVQCVIINRLYARCFIKRTLFLFFCIIHSNDEQFTLNFYQW